MSSTTASIAPVRTVRLKQVALPTEHGGWGFLFEPLVAGIAIAASPAGLFIALMTIGAFLSRQPLKVLIADRFGMRNRERATAAAAFLAGYGLIFAVGLTGALLKGGALPLAPFAFVLPFVAMQIYADARRKSRDLMPELTGAISISASAAAIMLAAGAGWSSAAALWLIFVARLIPSILYVRHRLRLEKGKDHSRAIPAAVHIAAFLAVAVLAYNGLSSYLPLFAFALMLVRSVTGLSPGRKPMRAMQIGILEVVYGTLTALSVIIGFYTGF